MTNNNSAAIIAICSHLSTLDGINPYSSKEWSMFAKKLQELSLTPGDLFDFSSLDLKKRFLLSDDETNRLVKLLGRSGSITFELEEYTNMGINVLTRADEKYPHKIKEKLGNLAPPLFYCAGNLDILTEDAIGFVGSRDIGDQEVSFIKDTVEKVLYYGYAVVSGGAKGADSVSETCALQNRGMVIEYVADSMIKKIKNKEVMEAIRKGRMLILSVTNPSAGFNTGVAMMRNKFIYAQADGTVVVKSDYNKGGTWSGATENLKNNWCKTLCWNNPKHKGNIELISRGAIPIDETWAGTMESFNNVPQVKSPEEQGEQISILSIL